ncbi:LptF/LptG family permease, partial [Sphingorhabdus sp.]|uniref:LptF/LptG family permease n=1 Tax=Sphingorhabdus sp. TaxID=1902408 RepID=UPI0037CB1ED6
MLPLLATLAIAASLLLLDKMLTLFDFVAAEGGPVSVVWRMLANLMPEYLSLGIPIGLLLGILLAFRKLATSSELDIFRAVGMSYLRLLRVPFLLAIALAMVNFAIVGFVQPSARYLYEELRFELRSGAFGAKVRVGEFNNVGKNLTMRIDESRNNGNALSGMFVYAQS